MPYRSSTSKAYVLGSFAVLVAGAVALSWAMTSRNPSNVGAHPSRAPASARASAGVALATRGAEPVADLVQRLKPAVVGLRRSGAPPSGGLEHERRRAPGRRVGSGVLVARDTILTSAHLLHDAQSIEVTTHDQRALTGYVIGVDARTDLAVLKIKPASPELPFLSLGDSSRVRPGKRVLALGRPPGIGQTVTTGVVIARSSSERDRAPQEALIRTDAVVDALNSGGALVDLDGKLIGIPRGPPPSAATSQVGVAIPSNTARTILKSLLEHGYVERGSIGVSLQAFDAALARALELANLRGVMISDVAARGPAATAGIRRGDVVLAVDGQAVESVPKLRSAIDNGTPGKQLRLEIARDGARSRVQVTVAGSRASGPPADRSGSNPVLTRTAGLVLASLDATTRRRLELPRSFAKGVLIEEVLAESSAEAAGIGPGDILLELDRKPVASRTEAARVWARSDGTVPALLFRSDRTFYAALEH